MNDQSIPGDIRSPTQPSRTSSGTLADPANRLGKEEQQFGRLKDYGVEDVAKGIEFFAFKKIDRAGSLMIEQPLNSVSHSIWRDTTHIYYHFLDSKMIGKVISLPRSPESFDRDKAIELERLGKPDSSVIKSPVERGKAIFEHEWKLPSKDIEVNQRGYDQDGLLWITITLSKSSMRSELLRRYAAEGSKK